MTTISDGYLALFGRLLATVVAVVGLVGVAQAAAIYVLFG